MSINILPGTKETLDQMKGQEFVPHKGEGVVYIKLAFIKPDTINNGDPAKSIEDAPAVVLCGQLGEIRDQLNTWFAEASGKYAEEPQEPKKPEPPKERW